MPTPTTAGYALAAACTTALTLLLWPMADTLHLANLVMLYLLPVVAIAFRHGRGPAIAAALLGVAAVDFFFVPPRFSLAVADAQYLLTFGVMAATGYVIAHLAAQLRAHAADAARRELEARELGTLARQLSAALADEQIAEAVRDYFHRAGGLRVALLAGSSEAALERVAVPGDHAPLPVDLTAARQAFRGEVLPATPGAMRYLPLSATVRKRGVMAVETVGGGKVDGLVHHETAAHLVAIAVERVHFVTVAREATVEAERERLRSGLLAALSHDLQTPLTAILGSAETMAMQGGVQPSGHRALLDGIRAEAQRTIDLMEKILDMARLETGRLALRREWQSLEEVVGAALASRATRLVHHPVDVAMPADLPLVECDAVLLECVVANLLENAAKYSPAGRAIRVEARALDGQLRVDVIDRGPGIPLGREEDIFGKFVRAAVDTGVPGLGLGLAICRTIVEAHRGTIRARNLPTGGAMFTFTLPLGEPPAVDLPEGGA